MTGWARPSKMQCYSSKFLQSSVRRTSPLMINNGQLLACFELGMVTLFSWVIVTTNITIVFTVLLEIFTSLVIDFGRFWPPNNNAHLLLNFLVGINWVGHSFNGFLTERKFKYPFLFFLKFLFLFFYYLKIQLICILIKRYISAMQNYNDIFWLKMLIVVVQRKTLKLQYRCLVVCCCFILKLVRPHHDFNVYWFIQIHPKIIVPSSLFL